PSCSLRPPSSSPFPYTTLFRSLRDLRCLFLLVGGERLLRLPQRRHPVRFQPLQLRLPVRFGLLQFGDEFLVIGVDLADRLEAGLDRKSTRLNSSHGSISYAVFC